MAAPVRVDDVLAMKRAGVHPELIAKPVRSHGMAAPLQQRSDSGAATRSPASDRHHAGEARAEWFRSR